MLGSTLVDDPDLVLVERWRAGEQRAGEALFARHFADIYRFFENKARGDADELVQRTFLGCLRSRDQFRGQSSFRTYLFAIARHELYRYLRELRRDEAVDFGVTSIAQLVTTPRARLQRVREAERLREALRELPVEQQLLLELHYWHDLDAAALAEVFEAPLATVRTRLFRARRALRQRLDQAALSGATDPMAVAISGDGEDE